MKEFKLYSLCKKCGFGEELHHIDFCVGIFDKIEQENKFIHAFGVDAPEYLMRTCRRCGYKWSEKCVDAKDGGVDTISIKDNKVSILTLELINKLKLVYGHLSKVVLYPDGSGHIENIACEEVFGFDDLQELIEHLNDKKENDFDSETDFHEESWEDVEERRSEMVLKGETIQKIGKFDPFATIVIYDDLSGVLQDDKKEAIMHFDDIDELTEFIDKETQE